MKKPLYVACNPLTHTIFCGNILKDGMTWASNKQDVTGMACAAVAQRAIGLKGSIIVSVDGKPKWEISAKEIE